MQALNQRAKPSHTFAWALKCARCALGFALCAVLSAQADAQTQPSYRFLANQNLAPLVMPNQGKPSGLVVELAHAMAEKAQIPMVLEATDWALAQEQLAQGQADALLQINPNPTRNKIFDFSEPLLTSRFLLYGKANDQRLRAAGDLAGLRIAVEAAGSPISYLKNNTQAEIVVAPSWAKGFKMVEGGQADALFVDEWVGHYALFLSKAKDILPVEPALFTDVSRIAVQKGNTALLSKINQGLQAIEHDGTKAAILDRWQGQEVVFFKRSLIDNILTMAAVAAIVLTLLALAYFIITSRRLRTVNEQLRTAGVKLQTTLTDAIRAQDSASQALRQLQTEQADKKRLSQELAVYADAIEQTLCVSRWDEQGRIVHVNDAILAYSEYSRDELLGQHRSIMRHPDTSAEEVAAMEQTLRDHGRYIGPWKNRSKTGQTRWSELLAVALPPNEHGQVQTMVLSMDQTTLQVHSAALEKNRDALVAANQASRELLNAQDSSVAILDRDCKVEACNEAYVRDLGLSANKAQGQKLSSLLGPEVFQERLPYIERVLAGEVVRFEGRIVRPDNTQRLWTLTYTPRRDVHGAVVGFYSCNYDITEAKQREAELIVAKEMAQASGLAKQQFLATISHELRTPLNGMLGAFELLRQEALSAQGQELLNTGLESGRLLMSIVGDVLDFSKIEAGHFQLDARPTQLPKLLGHIESLLRAAPRAREVRLRVDVGSGLEPAVLVDDTRLQQIVLNLASNALKFTHQGEVRISAERLARTAQQLEVLLVVQDSGIGMDQAMLAKLFQPFTQADSSHTRQYGGTGLGLSIAQRLAQAMGAEIEVHSQLGQGSRFGLRLQLPLAPAESAPAQDLPVNNLSLQGMQVLVVDDVAVNRLIASKLLQSLGMRTVEAADGQQAVQMLIEQGLQVDLVLMDLQMPFMGGLAATRLIRASGQTRLAELPIVALTGNVEAAEREQALAAGMNDFLTKPLQMAKLKAALARATAQTTV
jgi:PAS domain S-box-containing protein